MSMACRVQHGDAADGSGMTDVERAIVTITAADSIAEINVDCRGLRRFVRVIVTTTFTGGTAPAVLVAATIAMGEAVWLPAV
ncbi:MAG: hypothetical protein DDT19_02024 [Syntrophomonadaceae bacterium]|nr:hypothetical protein [Bacillota bacterium]